jgi:hypothetical protein
VSQRCYDLCRLDSQASFTSLSIHILFMECILFGRWFIHTLNYTVRCRPRPGTGRAAGTHSCRRVPSAASAALAPAFPITEFFSRLRVCSLTSSTAILSESPAGRSQC